MLVGAYRDNEVSPSHRFCGRWKRSAKLERGPGDCASASRVNDVGQLLADALRVASRSTCDP